MSVLFLSKPSVVTCISVLSKETSSRRTRRQSTRKRPKSAEDKSANPSKDKSVNAVNVVPDGYRSCVCGTTDRVQRLNDSLLPRTTWFQLAGQIVFLTLCRYPETTQSITVKFPIPGISSHRFALKKRSEVTTTRHKLFVWHLGIIQSESLSSSNTHSSAHTCVAFPVHFPLIWYVVTGICLA